MTLGLWPYGALKLPEAVLKAGTKVPAVRDRLRGNPFLPYSTWKDLLSDHGESENTWYLTRNIDRRRAGHLLSEVPNLSVTSRALANIDLAIASTLNQGEMGETLGRRVLASGLPNVANVALRSKRIPKSLKVKLARQSYRPNRLMWLTSEEADHLTVEETWEIAALPENLEECCKVTMLEGMLKADTLQYSAALLLQRPELIGRALNSTDPWWLMAAAAVPLDDAQQETLIQECEKHWEGEATEEILEALTSRFGYYVEDRAPDPVGLLGAAPWCSQETWEHLEKLDPKSATTWVENGKLLRKNRYSSTRTISIREKYDGAVQLSSCTPEEAEKWATWATYTSLLTGPSVAFELRKNRHTGRRASTQRRVALRAHSEALHEVLLRNGYKATALKEPYRYQHSDPEKETPRSLPVALPECPVPEALIYGDGGFKELEAAALTESEWETALVLHPEFTGTVQDLIGVVRAL